VGGPGEQRCKKDLCRQAIVLVPAKNKAKVIPLWNPEGKDTIQAMKVVYKAWIQNKATSFLHWRQAETRMSAAFTIKKSKI